MSLNYSIFIRVTSEILADNDTSFSSEFFNEVCSYFKTKVTHGVPYKCSSTSKAENSNKRINKALRVTLSDKQILDWDLYLNFVAFALNGIRSRHTGFSANQIVFGKHLNTPLDLELDGSPILLDNHATKKKTTAYVIYRTIRDIVRKDRRHAALDFGYADSAYNKKMLGPYFKQGDWVFTLMECPKHKFEKRWQGPFQITKKMVVITLWSLRCYKQIDLDYLISQDPAPDDNIFRANKN